MSNAGDIQKLQEAVTGGEIEYLLEKLKPHWPLSRMIYGVLVSKKTYPRIFDISRTKIFYSKNSTLVVVTPVTSERRVQSLSFFWDKEAEEMDTVVGLLTTIPRFDWTKNVFVFGSPFDLMEKLHDLLINGAIGEGLQTIHDENITYLFSMTSSATGFDPRVPEGFEIRRLGSEHSDHLMKNWKHSGSETPAGYKHLLGKVPSAGVFKIKERNTNTTSGKESKKEEGGSPVTNDDDDDDDDDMPVAWTHVNIFNVITNTFTLAPYRRMGLANAVTLAVAQMVMQETGVPASACVHQDNDQSIKMHERAGFTKNVALGFRYYKSSGCHNDPIIENF